MDFTIKTKVVKEVDILAEQYPHVLLLYKLPPTGEITLTEFEDLAFERVQVLRILEQTTQMGHKLFSEDWTQAVTAYLRKQNLRKYVRLIENSGPNVETSIRRDDYISHFILRLAYCRSHDLRVWFLSRELELFKLRFLRLGDEGVKSFIKANGLDYTPICSEEKDEIKDGLIQSTAGYSHVQIEKSDFYKVRYTEVPDLVRNASVYIRKGYAYIPTSELVSCVMSWMKIHLQEALLNASKQLPSLDDDRISGLLLTLHASYSGKDYSSVENSALTAENLHTYAGKSFPLCMKTLYDVLRTTHHLKHFGRLQFGLFLKGMGLSLEEAIKYWRGEFCKKIDAETFDKNYLYNIKHSYGAVGKMTSYAPYGCVKIISAQPGPGEHHGCPFKLWDAETLRMKMTEQGVGTDAGREIIDLAAKGNFQIACSKYFIHTHGGIEIKQVINHPNQYFDESQEITNPKKNKDATKSSKKRKNIPEPEISNSSNRNYSASQVQTQSTSQNQTQTASQMDDFDDGFDMTQVPDGAMDVD